MTEENPQYLICPHAEECRVYRNWVRANSDERLTIINYNRALNKYECDALNALRSADLIEQGKGLEGRLNPKTINETSCVVVESINKK